jgi:hypothetical protein
LDEVLQIDGANGVAELDIRNFNRGTVVLL